MKGSRLLTRREALGAVGAASAALAFGCGGDAPTSAERFNAEISRNAEAQRR
jgi:hypothetical protein